MSTSLSDSKQYINLYTTIKHTTSQAFWAEIAREFHWEEPWEETVSHNFDRSKGPIHVRFFHGGLTNIAYNALDRHVEAGALLYVLCRGGVNTNRSDQTQS